MKTDGDSTLLKRTKTANLKTKDAHIKMTREGYGTIMDGSGGNSGQKRKRIYAGRNAGSFRVVDGSADISKAKALSKVRKIKLKDYIVKEKRSIKGGSQELERSNKKNSLKRRTTPDESHSTNKKRSSNFRAKVDKVDCVNNVERDGSVNGVMNNTTKANSNLEKHKNDARSKVSFASLEKLPKKKAQARSRTFDEPDLTKVRPKKKKRVIRIDPHDITNKRLNDCFTADDKAKEKADNLEKTKNAEMSKNAQFRAIQPSPSIISFVEDNLLGRRREIELRRAGYNTDISVPLDNIPFSTNSEREKTEETIFRNKLAFFAAAKVSSSIPPPDLPEIAFAGRSNVGKSSLLNSLTRQWGVVRTSDKPGLTQTINFFKLGSKVCLVDLPGYGFAYAKEEVKEAWEELVKEYVSTRVGLKQVCLLIDTKWGMKPRDHEVIDLMERSQTKYQIVLTKTDLVFPIDVARRAMQIEESLKANKSIVQPVMMVSSKSGAGVRSLRTMLSKIARFAKL